MKEKKCDIGTLASELKNQKEINDPNVCKVVTEKDIRKHSFSKALDFYRNSNTQHKDTVFHHVGIYAFTTKALIRYVGLKRSKNEMNRNLEQLRALDNDMKINVVYTDDCPLSIDTEEDLNEIKKKMEII